MALITKTFNYEGGVRIAEVPAGTTTLTMHLWAGAGGGGGRDTAGDGGSGSAGHYVTKTELDMTSYAGAKNISVSVGGGGAGGTMGQGSEGGINGKSLTDYSHFNHLLNILVQTKTNKYFEYPIKWKDGNIKSHLNPTKYIFVLSLSLIKFYFFKTFFKQKRVKFTYEEYDFK